MAPATGAKLKDPLIMFVICAASMLLTLYFCIKYTRKLLIAPFIANPTPRILPSTEKNQKKKRTVTMKATCCKLSSFCHKRCIYSTIEHSFRTYCHEISWEKHKTREIYLTGNCHLLVYFPVMKPQCWYI